MTEESEKQIVALLQQILEQIKGIKSNTSSLELQLDQIKDKLQKS